MPFVTEELWQRVPKPADRKASVAFGPYPEAKVDALTDATVMRQMNLLKAIISAARTVRSEHEVPPGSKVPVWIRTDAEETRKLLGEHAAFVTALVKIEGAATVEKAGGERPQGATTAVVPSDLGAVEVLVGLKGLVTADQQLARIERDLARIEKDIAALEKKLANKGFTDRAPPEVVAEAKAQLASLIEAKARLEEAKKLAAEL